MAVNFLAHPRVVHDAPVADHSACDARGAPRGLTGQEQLLLGHWGKASHHLLYHCVGREQGWEGHLSFLQGLAAPPSTLALAHSREWLSSMKPKGGPKCSKRSHSLWLKCRESRKRVRLGRKRLCSHGDWEALTLIESGQVCRQEG